jgi:hypothetical protein
MNSFNYDYKPWHVHVAFGISLFLSFFFLKQMVTLQAFPLLIILLWLSFLVSIFWIDHLRMHSTSMTLSCRNAAMGGHTTINPEDFAIASAPQEEGDLGINYAVFATGGFVKDITANGKENYVVCRAELVEKNGDAYTCHAKLRRIDMDFLPDYVQDELFNLPKFDPVIAKKKRNILYGITSKIDGTATAENLRLESKIIQLTKQCNFYERLTRNARIITDIAETKQPQEEGRIVQMPPEEERKND